MKNNVTNKYKIDKESILGLHYSGMHDSSISIISKNGKIIFSSSLERYSRIKQDGRFPKQLVDLVDLNNISKVAISTAESYTVPADCTSIVHPVLLKHKSIYDRSHEYKWKKEFNTLFYDKEIEYFNHHISHASSSFYTSGLDDAICLVYDGGMSNEDCFGGVYFASKDQDIKSIDLFSGQEYSNITYIYLTVTALLGFTPMKHEGKITGLAALGNVTEECKKLLKSWFVNPSELGGLFKWENMYSDTKPPFLDTNIVKLEELQLTIENFSKEDVAATIQYLAEEHVLEILRNIKKLNLKSKNICLSGGLFANVKINQKIYEFGFDNIFIAPPMSDDGTSLGAAYLALPIEKRPKNKIDNMYLGNSENINSFLNNNNNIKILNKKNPAKYIAEKLSEGEICAIFQGKSEFGPRALCNRTILAQATQSSVNDGLNAKLSRTEFMPFAPVIRDIDVDKYFILKDGEKNTARFMTITCKCTKLANNDCPALIHVDNTARPQIISENDNIFTYDILKYYSDITNKYALVNTSFNIHEEPIVNSYDDAIKGFFESGLDFLYLDGVIISLEDNLLLHVKYLKDKLKLKENSLKNTLFEKNKFYSIIKENNQKLQHLETKANEAETKASEAETKANEAETKASEAEEKAIEAEIKASEAETKASEAEEKAIEAEIKASEAETKASEAETKATQAEANYHILLQSNSWKITKPYRYLGVKYRWFIQGSKAWITFALLHHIAVLEE